MLLEESLRKNIKKDVKESFIAPLLIILFGIVLLRNPENFIEIAINIFGYGAVFIGILEVVLYFRTREEQRLTKRRLANGTLLITFGIVAFFEVTILKEMTTILLGGYILFQNANRLELSMVLQKYTQKLWMYLGLISLLNLILSLLLMLNPFTNIPTNIYIASMLFIVEGLFIIENIMILIGVPKNEDEKK